MSQSSDFPGVSLELLREFEMILRLEPITEVPRRTRSVMVLGAAELHGPNDPSIHGKTAENTARIEFAVSLAKKKSVPLVLNGETEQLQWLGLTAQEAEGGSLLRFFFVDSGAHGTSNTLTQMDRWKKHREFRPLTPTVIVVSRQQVPRVARTAAKHLPQGSFWVTGAPFDTSLRTIGELMRIPAYIQKGDISPEIPPGIIL